MNNIQSVISPSLSAALGVDDQAPAKVNSQVSADDIGALLTFVPPAFTGSASS